MQFPESWLREHCNPPLSTEALADLLTMAGMKVEATRPVAPPFHGVVVGQVLSVQRHPNADRLSVCSVDVGTGSPLGIVCGAPNVRVGMKAPVALVGAELPADAGAAPHRIKLSELRGAPSQGMLCSARELKLSEDHGGLLELDAAAPVGQDIRSHLMLDDTLFTLKLTPNLGHVLSVHGVAREVAALTGAPLLSPGVEPVALGHDAVLPVDVQARDLCGRFSGRIVRNVNPKAPTPAWMVDRLARCGQRSVTALVDISNYVMFEFGQPTHIFDLDKIDGGLTVRWGRSGESLKLLNGSTVGLDGAVGVIADEQAVESLAGIMGGDASALSDAPRNIYVEAAFWWPEAVAGRSRRFNFTTDAGHRFERGVDPSMTVANIERITRLVLDICGGEAGPVDDQVLALPACEPVTLRVERAARVIGMPVTQAQCEDVMRRLALPYRAEPGRLHVSPPSWRFDLRIEEDLIEEVIRVLGYESLPDAPPLARVQARVGSEARRGADSLRETMAALNYQETINFSFVDECWERDLAGNADPIRLLNPIAAQWSVMRSSLVGSLLEVLRFNLARKADRVRVFEVGRVYRRDAGAVDGPVRVAGIDQPLQMAGLAYGSVAPAQWGQTERPTDFFDLKGDVESLLGLARARFVAAEHPALHPGRCARIEIGGRSIGHLGELHPQWRQAYGLPAAPMLFELDAEALAECAIAAFRPLQRQQSAWRDIAVIAADRVSHDDLMACIGAGGPDTIVRSALLFDVYRPTMPGRDIGTGERSLAIRLELLDDQLTLTDERIDSVVKDVLTALQQRLGVRLRG